MLRGDIVFHKALPGVRMVIISKFNHECEGYTCCYYNVVTGDFSHGNFYVEELELVSN
jgi:hypothetical protein